MTKIAKLLLAGLAAVSVQAAMAHGPEKPKYGGNVSTAQDLGFELADKDGTATIYVEDHGKPMSTEGMTGKLTVLNGADKAEAELMAAAPNKLEAKGVKLAAGAKAVATITLPSKKVTTVRFTVK